MNNDALKPAYSCSEQSGTFPDSLDICTKPDIKGGLELGLSKWKVEALAALKVGVGGFQSMILKVFLIVTS